MRTLATLPASYAGNVKELKMAEQEDLREEPMETDTSVPNGSEKKGVADIVSGATSKPAHDLPW